MIHIACLAQDAPSRLAFDHFSILLRANGYDNTMSFYTTPQDALETMPLERPDMLFFDMRIPGGMQPGGLELVRILRRHPLLCKTTFIAMVEYPMPADETAARAAGCDGLLSKPARYQRVEEFVAQATNDL